MALRTNRVLKKYAPFYSRVRVTEGSDSDGASMRSRPSSFTWLHRAFPNSFSHAHVPLSESPKRELRMRSATKVGRHHNHSKKQKKQFPKLWWWASGILFGLPCAVFEMWMVSQFLPPPEFGLISLWALCVVLLLHFQIEIKMPTGVTQRARAKYGEENPRCKWGRCRVLEPLIFALNATLYTFFFGRRWTWQLFLH